MANTPHEFKNPALYAAYLNLLNTVTTRYHSLFSEIYRLNKSKEDFDYDPYLKSEKARLIEEHDFEGLELLHTGGDILLQRIVSFLVDGLFPELVVMKEYMECVEVMDNDPVIRNQVNKAFCFLGTISKKSHWTYLSHFLKRAIFKYLQEFSINPDIIKDEFSDLESFFYRNQIQVTDISPMHHFQLQSISNGNPKPLKECIKLSDSLQLRPVTQKDKLRFWDKFPNSRLDKTFQNINYILEYNYSTAKSFEGSQNPTRTVESRHIFSTVTTLFRLLGVHFGIVDMALVTKIDLPIQEIPLDLGVASLDVAFSWQPNAFPKLSEFKVLWAKYGQHLIEKVLNGQRFENDPFGNLKLSIDRFNDSFERKNGIDAFIDNIIAIEALFSKDDDKFTFDKTENLSKRLALFLEEDSEEREFLFCEMINLYRERNKIIHGGYSDKYDIAKTRDYLIRSYMKYFEFLGKDGFSHHDFIRALDLDLGKILKNYNDCVSS